MGGNWKTNTGTSVVEPIELKPEYKLWADEAAKMFGGVDILAVDAIHTTDGKEYILEVNDSSIGLMPGK
jgi:glutathione synthase/RimK-type ligase-like ATP-grasp enzyme